MRNQSKEEVEFQIAQLRYRLNDVITRDKKFDNNFYLYRWLINQNMNVEKTAKSIRESIEWRKKNNVEELANLDWAAWAPGLNQDIPVYFGGYTKIGQPITTSSGDNIDLHAIVEKYGKEALSRYFNQLFIKLEKCMLDHYQNGPSKNQDSNENSNELKHFSELHYNHLSWYSAAPIHLVSYRNFSFWNATCLEGIQVLVEGAKIGLNYFPAVLSEIHLVNLNKFSNMIVKIIKPMLTTQSFDLFVFGADEKKWTKALLHKIDEDQLPRNFGRGETITNNGGEKWTRVTSKRSLRRQSKKLNALLTNSTQMVQA